MSHRGCYIVFEGGDGVGKSTQIDLLIERLAKKSIKASYVHDTKGTKRAREIYRQVTDPENDFDPLEEVEFFNQARKESLPVIDEMLKSGEWCIADRSFRSTIAYQGYGREQDILTVFQLADEAAFLKADLTIVMDLDAETALKRAQKRSKLDRFEQLDLEFHDRVREGFLDIAVLDQLPVIDASQSQEEIAQEVWLLVKPWIGR